MKHAKKTNDTHTKKKTIRHAPTSQHKIFQTENAIIQDILSLKSFKITSFTAAKAWASIEEGGYTNIHNSDYLKLILLGPEVMLLAWKLVLLFDLS